MTTAGIQETPPDGVRVCGRPRRAFHVVATRQFAPGETIERAPVIDFPARDWTHVEQTALGGYAFPWANGGGGVALGYGALYGRSATPIARSVAHIDDRILEIVADRAIESGEEILIEGEAHPATPLPAGIVIEPPIDVWWALSPGRGRGVFASRDLVAGETIERSPCIPFRKADWSPIEKTPFDDYCFAWGSDRKDGTLPLGYGSVYNHSFEPNATYVRRVDEHVMDFVAIRDISKGHEIRTNYNRDPLDTSPVWFEVVP